MFIFAQLHIGFRIRISKITCFEISHRDIYLASVIFHSTIQLSATFEHILRLLTSPYIGIDYCLQTRTIVKHLIHIRHLRGVEIRNIEFFQTRATREHLTHICYRGGVELKDVEIRQTRTTLKHPCHIRYCRGVEVLKAYDYGECFEIRKPRFRSYRAVILERIIKLYCGDHIIRRFICSSPGRF